MAGADHLVFTRLTVKPDNAELISIKNPTQESISLENYYLSDNPNYYKIQSDNDLSPTSVVNDFIVKFPVDSFIEPGDSILIAIQSDYKNYYGDDFNVDYVLRDDLIETESGSFGLSSNGRFDDSQECLILFYWEGNSETPVKDVDYLLWGVQPNLQAVDKTDIFGYLPDTPLIDQISVLVHDSDYTFIRRSIDEQELINGNGITGDDETSEDFNYTWESIPAPEFIFGCMEPNADNYNIDATIDDGNCAHSFETVIHNCSSSVVPCSGSYDLPGSNSCSLYNREVSLIGTVVDFYDITPRNGPFSFKIQDENGFRISFVVWKDDFNILSSSLSEITQPPFNRFVVKITGTLDVYCRNQNELNIFNDWQVAVDNEVDIKIIEQLERTGDFIASDINTVSVSPAPFIIIPTLGETLDFSFTVLDDSRAIIRIFDLSGRFVTSLVDKFYENSGEVNHQQGLAPWNGRDNLGQIVPPGTYIMHLEVFNPSTGETQTDSAPIVVGVRD